ncbi:SWIM-type domain-containing protein, partial [Aphis craccivora]
DFCCTKLEDYYRRKYQEFSNDRNPTARKYFEKIIKLCDYASKDEIYVENEEYYVPSEENKQLMHYVEPTIVNFPSVTIEDKYLIAKLSPISHDIHQDSNKKSSTESMQIVKEYNSNLEKQDCLSILDDITQKLSINIIKYGESTYENLLIFKKRLDKIHTEGQFNTFLATADGLIEDDKKCEIKCPYSVKDYCSLEKAISDKKILRRVLVKRAN